MIRFLALVVLCTGCYTKVYEPSLCRHETADTVGAVTIGTDTTNVILHRRCDRWCAWSDSTKCWDADGERLP